MAGEAGLGEDKRTLFMTAMTPKGRGGGVSCVSGAQYLTVGKVPDGNAAGHLYACVIYSYLMLPGIIPSQPCCCCYSKAPDE
ncbi:hypothetical protein M440DRAFT_342934 [Trichoderma longibrachiatum ATCC 18648]|uniref:Uncharacterized protein n=1 Tax=Trichoderma longibrachiatum ATCC 18648 TaxID=983965 RepID=A0A2T4C1L0_TRILO|nr:hypothetical protein M440DRAFT_342934 [Trichoderma longibrachiatum ATCC 18648]